MGMSDMNVEGAYFGGYAVNLRAEAACTTVYDWRRKSNSFVVCVLPPGEISPGFCEAAPE
eukprot:1288820-Amorphochlora_amoeboformis.AAC.1